MTKLDLNGDSLVCLSSANTIEADDELFETITEVESKSKVNRTDAKEHKQQSPITLYKETLKLWTSFPNFTEQYSANFESFNKTNFIKTLKEKSNLLFVFVTDKGYSFGVFESRQFPQPLQTSEPVYTTGSGNHFIFSLNNDVNQQFKVERKSQNFVLDLFDKKEFCGVYSQQNKDLIFEIFGFIKITLAFQANFMTNDYIKVYNDTSSGKLKRFVGENESVKLKEIFVYQCH